MDNDIICGPILRKVDRQQFVLWWVSYQECEGRFLCYDQESVILECDLSSAHISHFKVGKRAVVHLLNIQHAFPENVLLDYDLSIKVDSTEQEKNLQQLIPTLHYPTGQRPSFFIVKTVTHLLHGSCRNPHHRADDSLIAGDEKLLKHYSEVEKRPSLLMLSGDQIYADHVAGPMLLAIHKVIELLGLNDETFSDASFDNSSELHALDNMLYRREAILPRVTVTSRWGKTRSEPIFTSTSANNHLISFAETMAMYFLVWSPKLWDEITLPEPEIEPELQALYQTEYATMQTFRKGLVKVQRLMANIPCYMIFDDHDVTDDWNLTAQWEKNAYENLLSQRVIGNALIAYWLCQGWGNDPQSFQGEFWQYADRYQQLPNDQNHNEFIRYLYQFNRWHYAIDTQPKLVVLDSRTQRWRSESNTKKPSGLMDWESLCHLQQILLGEPSVILVSPAPIFGVKLIESIQRLATIAGHPLAVDAENWMAHPGAAHTLLNIFRHPKTPKHFVILSGDVHYSFVYDVEIRFRDCSPKIWQITSSGIKNQFPSTLINILDKMNRYLYSIYSPLNIFTKRRDMKVLYREVKGDSDRRLIEKSGLGYVQLKVDGSPAKICDLHNDGSETEFIPHL